MEYSVGFAITEKIREAIALVPKKSRCGPRYRPSFVWIGFATSFAVAGLITVHSWTDPVGDFALTLAGLGH